MSEPAAPNDTGPARADVRVQGTVQGVGFRYFLRREALRLHLVGWTANQPDGSVAAVAEGARGALDQFIEVISVGPPGASVTYIDVRWGPPTGEFGGFAIRSGWHTGD